MDYIIEEFKCGYNGNINDGPVERCNIVTMQYSDGNTTKWLSNYEVEDVPNFYLTDRDIFDDLLNGDYNNDEYLMLLKDTNIKCFNGIDLSGYENMYYSLADNDSIEAKLIKALFIVSRCFVTDLEPVINLIVDTSVNENKVLNASLADIFFYE